MRLTPAEAVRLARAALEGGAPCASLVVVEGPEAGARRVLLADGAAGTLGDPALDAAADDAARAVLEGRARAGVRTVLGRGVFVEAHRAPPSLVIVGAGHLARPLCRLGAMLGMRVTVLDDRPDFATRERFPEAAAVRRADFADPFRGVPLGPDAHVVLVTRGHKYDFEALRDLLARPGGVAYVGMVGSRRRVRAAMEQLAREGIPPERLAAVHAPIGLDLGAETPEEIAVAIAAELVLVRRGGSGAPLRDRDRVVARWIAPRRESGTEGGA